MRIDKVLVIAKREYASRIKTKGFWIGTVVIPLFMLAMAFVPGLLLSRTKTALHIGIVDETGRFGPEIAKKLGAESVTAPAPGSSASKKQQATTFNVDVLPLEGDRTQQQKALDQRVLKKSLDAWVWLSDEGLAKNRVEYHGESVSNFITQERLTDVLSDVIRDARLREAGYDAAKVSELTKSIRLDTKRITEAGSRAEAGMAGFFLAYFLFLLLYMVIMIYGQQVLTGVLEEKTSRVVELMVSSVQPFELMIGKLGGICMVALTQVLIWLLTAALITAPAVVTSLAFVPDGVTIPPVTPTLILHFIGLFIIGFFMYSTFYAAVGAAFNDIKEAQQAASSAAFLLVPSVLFMFSTINDPDSTTAVVTSLIPPLTPLLMMLRIAVKTPPAWQIALGYLLSATFSVGMVWLCAKIYRVGILMYGKKPTFKELWQWVRYAS